MAIVSQVVSGMQTVLTTVSDRVAKRQDLSNDSEN